MLMTRTITAVILAPLFLVVVGNESPYFDVLIAAIVMVISWEFTRMDVREWDKRRVLISAASVLAVASVWLFSGFGPAVGIVAASTLTVVIADQVAGRKGFALVQLAVIYAALPGVALLYVHHVGGPASVYWLLAAVWMTDIGAYAFGRMIGGPKLAPSISPNKTWAGAIGGFACGVAAGHGVMTWLELPFSVGTTTLGGVVSVCTQVGDLFESGLKRRYHVKDSGGLIPGHGGAMDRFDGLWVAAPAAALFCLIFEGGIAAW